MVARSRTRPPAQTSSTCNRTRSQPLSLLSMARLKKSEIPLSVLELEPDPDRPNVLGFQRALLSGETAFVPGSTLHDRLHQPTTPSAAPADWQARDNLSERRVSAISRDVQSRHARLPRPTRLCRSAAERASAALDPEPTFL